MPDELKKGIEVTDTNSGRKAEWPESPPRCKRCDAVFVWWAKRKTYCKICIAEMEQADG